MDSVLSFPHHTLFVFWTFFCFFLNRLTANERASISRAVLEIEANAVMYIHKCTHSCIQKSHMKLPSGTGNPGWSCTQPELVCCEAWWLHSIIEWSWVSSEELWRSRDVLSAAADNTLWDLQHLLWYLPWLVFLYPHTFNMHICFNYSC